MLVNPQIVTSTWNARLLGTDDVTIRHALAQLSALLKQAGHTVSLADFRLMSGWAEFESRVAAERPDFLCMTIHTCERDVAIDAIRRVRRLSPESKIITGGIEPSMHAQDFIDAGAQFVIRGEGDRTLIDVVADPGHAPAIQWGVSVPLDDLPFEDRELWPDYAERIRHQMVDFPAPTPVVDVICQRGCPWQCKFCCGPGEQNLYTKAARRSGKRVFNFRARSPENVCAELKQLHDRYQYRSLIFHDDQFIIDAGWVDGMIEAFKRHGLADQGIKFWCAIRADMICRHGEPGGLIERLAGIGMHMTSIGFESFSDRMLKFMVKGTTAEQNFRAAEILQRLGVHIYANFILGMPFEDGRWHVQDDLATLQAIEKIHPSVASSSFFSPIPGSPFYEEFESQLKDKSPEGVGMRFAERGIVFGVDYPKLEDLMDQHLRYIRKVSPLRYHTKRILRRVGLLEQARTVYRALRHHHVREAVAGKKL